MTPRVRIGTQGWAYADWAGPFYPAGSPSGDWLSLYARAFDTVEVDSTFYAVPAVERIRSWLDRTPPDFLFSLKLPGEITHGARLRDDGVTLRSVCDVVAGLGDRLGTLLVQLPPDFGPVERPAVAAFVERLPADMAFAIEFRNARWFEPATYDMLAAAGVGLAVSVGPWLDHDAAIDLAAAAPGAALYIRFLGVPRHVHGPAEVVRERDRALDRWAAAFRAGLAADRDVLVYFNNDFQGHAPESARRLQRRLGLDDVPPAALNDQGDLFGGPP